MNLPTNTFFVTTKEMIAAIAISITALLTISYWIILPQRVSQLETILLDHETRLRKQEETRTEILVIRSTLEEMKRKLDKHYP